MDSSGGTRASSPERGASGPRSGYLEAALVVLAFVGLLAFYRTFATGVAGDSDPYGYVSEAILLSQGQVVTPERVFGLVGLPEDTRFTHPVAFAPYTTSTLVPTYPFGYPLLMALGIVVAGLPAAYLVTPLLAAGAVVLTYFLGRIWLGRLGGLVSAFLIFVFPTYMFCAFAVWSDVPATFFAVLSLYLLLRPNAGKWSDLGLGAALGYAIWVRPNMALLVLLVGAWLIWRREWSRSLRVGLVLLPFVLVEAVVNQVLYGAPWVTGYGDLPLAPTVADAGARLVRYLDRLNGGQAGVGALLVLIGCLASAIPRSVRLLLVGIGVAYLAFYSVYGYPDGAWWYGRFLLPSFPGLAVIEAGGLIWLFEVVVARLGPSRRRQVMAVSAAALLAFGLFSGLYARQGGAFRVARSEQTWVQSAQSVAESVEQPAVVLSMVFSGTLRFYGDLATIRYDVMPADELIERLLAFEQAGGHVYVFGEQRELDAIGRTQGGKLKPLMEGSEEVLRLDVPPASLRRLNVSSTEATAGS